MRKRKLTGSDWSFLGVSISVIGTLIAAYGSKLSGADAKDRADQLAVKSDEIATLNREIADLSQKQAAYVTGEGSYFYLHIQGFGSATAAGRSHEEIKHVGDNPVRDTEILVYDITGQIPDAVAGRIRTFTLDEANRKRHYVNVSYPERPGNVLDRELLQQNPTSDSYAYFILLSESTGIFREVIQLVRGTDEWKQAYYVERRVGPSHFEVVGEHFDAGFPTTADTLQPRPNVQQLP